TFRRVIYAAIRSEADLVHLARQPAMIGDTPNPMLGRGRIRNSDSSHHTVLGTDFEAYYRGKRNSDSRRTDRSKHRRLAVLGDVRTFDAVTPADIDRIMDALFAQKQSQLNRMGIRDMFDDDAVKAFYRELAHTPYPKGISHVAALEVDGRILATNWGLVRHDHYYYVMHSYDVSTAGARYSPGRYLMYHLMQWCVSHGIATFDFTIGDEDFKAQWCETSNDLYDSIVPLRLRALDVALFLSASKPVKRFIKTNDLLRTLAMRGRRSLAGR
ncbi:MAG: GNAT family N-acetyltransferase, partial [Alphaproteobacteria bacterium]